MATDSSAGLKFARTHEWVRLDGDIATIGISNYAQTELGDVTYIDLPWDDVGQRTYKAGDHFGDIDSVKTTSELFTPVSGTLMSVNEALRDVPEIVNSAPETDGWMLTIKVSDPSELDQLMDADAYNAYTDSLH